MLLLLLLMSYQALWTKSRLLSIKKNQQITLQVLNMIFGTSHLSSDFSEMSKV